MQRPLPDNTQHSQETDIHAPRGFEPPIPVSERPNTNVLDREVTGISPITVLRIIIFVISDSKELTA